MSDETTPSGMQCVGFEQITGLSSVKGFTVATMGQADAAVVDCETQSVRWRQDGTNPSATVGMILPVNTDKLFVGDLDRVKFIESAASAKLNVTYYKMV